MAHVLEHQKHNGLFELWKLEKSQEDFIAQLNWTNITNYINTMDDTEYMTEEEARKYIEKEQRKAKYENKKEERETGLNYKLLKS